MIWLGRLNWLRVTYLLLLMGVNVAECEKCFHVACWQTLVKRSSRYANDSSYICARTAATYSLLNTSSQPTVSVLENLRLLGALVNQY